MNNPVQPNVLNLNQQQAAELVDDVFGDLPDNIEEPNNNEDPDAAYERKFVSPFPQDKVEHVIHPNQLVAGNVYFKVMDHNTKYDKHQMIYVGNPDNTGVIFRFKDNLGTDNIPLTLRDRFIPASFMLGKNSTTDQINHHKRKISAIEGVHEEATSGDEDSSDEDSDDSDLEGGKKRTPSKKQKKFHFTSTQKHQHGGKKTVRHVTIKNGKGHKKVSHYRGNKLVGTVKKSLKKTEMEMISLGKFIPGLFRDCKVSRKKGTMRCRRKK